MRPPGGATQAARFLQSCSLDYMRVWRSDTWPLNANNGPGSRGPPRRDIIASHAGKAPLTHERPASRHDDARVLATAAGTCRAHAAAVQMEGRWNRHHGDDGR